ncbi:MAG TPA: DNA-binding domain-containing protein [Candidatus Limnocylindria bacterium]|nr:DNA-binding domain-containing protein [Candidatus Limnocylindria bacterium]
MLALRDLQQRFYRSLAAAPGPMASEHFDAALLALVEGGRSLDARARLDVYAQMYWARLHDVLAEDYPRLAAILGPERFRNLACRYLAAHPSEQPSVRHLGSEFAAFVSIDPDTRDVPFAGDLARLEWARLAVFDAPDAEPLRLEDLRAVPADEWPALSFALAPAVRVLRAEWPVHDVWRSLAGHAPAEVAPSTVRPAYTRLRVWRTGFMVYQASMDAAEDVALACVVAGQTFARICEALATVVPPAEAARTAAELVLRWIADGILIRR